MSKIIIFLSAITFTMTSQAMSLEDLNRYQIDCSKKEEQIQILNSLRTTESERQWLRLRAKLMPWTDQTVGDNREETMINQHLHTIATQC